MKERLHHNFLKQIAVACETECHGKGAFFVLKRVQPKRYITNASVMSIRKSFFKMKLRCKHGSIADLIYGKGPSQYGLLPASLEQLHTVTL